MEGELEGLGADSGRAVGLVEEGHAVERLDLESWVHDQFLVEGFVHHRHVERRVLVLGQHLLSPRAALARPLTGPLLQQEGVETINRKQHHRHCDHCVSQTQNALGKSLLGDVSPYGAVEEGVGLLLSCSNDGFVRCLLGLHLFL